MFKDLTQKFIDTNWTLLFTDASKTIDCTAFAVVDGNSDVLIKGILPQFSSTFTAEALAVFRATKLLPNKNILICTDSLSTIYAIQNINNTTPIIEEIRDNLITNKHRLKIIWVPGHAGISGNEQADKAAKSATTEPLITFYTHNKKDLKNKLKTLWNNTRRDKWKEYIHHYSTINPQAEMALYSPNCC